MSKAKKALPDHLLAAVAPHLSPEAEATKTPKAVAKTLKKLAKQLGKEQRKATKALAAPVAPAAPAAPTAKQARKALTSELATALQPYLTATTADGETTTSLPKPVTKVVKRLATYLTKQRRRQAKRAAKATPAPEAAAPTKASAPARKPKSAPAAAAAAPTRRRTAAPKRPAAPAVAAAPAEAGETA